MKRRAQHRLLFDLLGALGNGRIDVGSFWRRMREADLDDVDIDQFLLDEYGCRPDKASASP